jgi:signal transduction histidine kinase
MKLRTRYNRVTLITTIILMLITGIGYYQAISWILSRQKDKDLKVEEQEIFDYVKLNNHLPQTFETDDQQIAFSEAPSGSVRRKFIDTIYFNRRENEGKRRHHRHDNPYEPGRGLITSVVAGGKYYKVVIIESKVETEDLLRPIFAITFGVILLLLLVLFMANKLILSRLWQPFYGIMNELRQFSLADAREINKPQTDIEEFKELNTAVADMTSKARHDYKDLKAFTENASHELLTPIAVINSKLDSLIQTENFNERQSKLLNDLYGAVSRLNRLNQSLLLLVKIENRLLHERQHISLREIIGELLLQFEEIFMGKELTVTSNLGGKEIYASRYLAEILISNLIGNAIRHNYPGGKIIINLTAENLVIQNTGAGAPLQEQIFTRFYKSSGSEGSGLGLTISRQICENFGFTLNYNFTMGYHTFIVDFAG